MRFHWASTLLIAQGSLSSLSLTAITLTYTYTSQDLGVIGT